MSLQRIFGRKLSPEELVKKWRGEIRQQERQLDRQIRSIEREEAKAKQSLKEVAKKGDKTSCKMLAKEIVHARKSVDRIHTSKAQLNSVGMQLQQQMSQVKVAGALKKSTDIMKMVNRLVKLPEISKAMMDMEQEMMKAGIIEEMMEDTMDSVLDGEEDIEEEAEEEVEKVLMELTSGLFGQVEGAPVGNLPSQEVEAGDILDSGSQKDAIESRLEALKSL